jgi:hypothetical protein
MQGHYCYLVFQKIPGRLLLSSGGMQEGEQVLAQAFKALQIDLLSAIGPGTGRIRMHFDEETIGSHRPGPLPEEPYLQVGDPYRTNQWDSTLHIKGLFLAYHPN